MKRGLKVDQPYLVGRVVVGYNPYPDEKGTERLAHTEPPGCKHLVTIPTPMKRGLKAFLCSVDG